MADDDPYELLDQGEPTGIVELPPEWIRDDAVYFNMLRFSALRPYTPPSSVEEVFPAEFEGAYREGGLFLLTMHPHVIGHRSRIALLDRLVAEGFAPGNIVLAGFSQGGVIASFTALRYQAKLAGLLCMSTYLAAPEQLVEEMSEAARALPICYMHGIYDDVVSLSMGWDA